MYTLDCLSLRKVGEQMIHVGLVTRMHMIKKFIVQ